MRRVVLVRSGVEIVVTGDGVAVEGTIVPWQWERDPAQYYPDPVGALAADVAERLGAVVLRDEGQEPFLPDVIY